MKENKNWKKQIALFLISQNLSMFGSSVVGFSIVWYITVTTESGFWITLSTLATLIPFAPVQIPVGMSVTYAVGKVANAWLEAGCPEDLSAFKTTYEEARIEGIKMLGELKNMACKDKPLGDESRRFEVDDDSPANKKVDDLLRKVKGVLKKD